MTIKQVTAVVLGVQSALGMDKYNELESKEPMKDHLTSDQLREIKEDIVQGILEGEVDFSETAKAKYIEGDGNLNSYVSGLINNHLKKDKRLNGGIGYVPKNPGSKAGQGDKKLAELKKMLKVVSVQKPEAVSLVQAKIDERIQEIAAEKLKSTVIDINLIPEELRDLVLSATTEK